MNRINQLFSTHPHNLLSIYFCAGAPTLDGTADVIRTLAANGIDMIEVGMPFSDPMADGPVIQDAATRALRNGMSLRVLFEQLRDIRRGVCGAFPVRFEGIDPCRYCNYRSVCLFDDRLDAARVRRPKTLSIEEAMLKMKLEQEPGAQTEENGE